MEMEMECMVVTQREFQILASFEGLERFCGFALEDQVPQSEEELWPILLEMVRKGELLVKDEEWHLTEPEPNRQMGNPIEVVPYLKTVFAILKNAAGMAVIYPGNDDGPTKCFYPAESAGGKSVILQNSNVNSKEIKIFLPDREMAWNSVWSSLEEAGYTPPEERETMDMEVLSFDGEYVDAQMLRHRPDVLLLIDKIHIASAKTEGRCLLLDEGISPVLLMQEGEEQRKEYLSRAAIQEFLGGYLI